MYKGSIISRLACLALAACAVAPSAAGYVVDRGRTICRRTAAWFVDRFDWLASKIKPAQSRRLTSPQRALLGGAQLRGRITRHDRPNVCQRWRMCPST